MKVPKSGVELDFFGTPYFKDPDYNSAPDNDRLKFPVEKVSKRASLPPHYFA